MTYHGVFSLFHNKNHRKMQWNDLFDVIFRLKNGSYSVENDSRLNMILCVQWKDEMREQIRRAQNSMPGEVHRYGWPADTACCTPRSCPNSSRYCESILIMFGVLVRAGIALRFKRRFHHISRNGTWLARRKRSPRLKLIIS